MMKIDHILNKITMSLMIGVLASCTYLTPFFLEDQYEGPRLNDSELSIVNTANHSLRILTVDGRRVQDISFFNTSSIVNDIPLPNKVKITPGTHTIDVAFKDYTKNTTPVRLSHHFLEGHTYIVNFKVTDYDIQYSIEDNTK